MLGFLGLRLLGFTVEAEKFETQQPQSLRAMKSPALIVLNPGANSLGVYSRYLGSGGCSGDDIRISGFGCYCLGFLDLGSWDPVFGDLGFMGSEGVGERVRERERERQRESIDLRFRDVRFRDVGVSGFKEVCGFRVWGLGALGLLEFGGW